MSVLSRPEFHDEAKAFEHLESIIWADGRSCPHCGKKHLHRYVAEFEFRYNNREANGFNDRERSEQALSGIIGKRLTYSSTGIGA